MAYNLSAFAGAGAQFFDDNGTPLTGGLLYTYLAGTTTPATTYTNATGSTAHTNPIVLDSAGRTPAEIWVVSGVLYKFVLKDANDVLIGTYDNIPGIDDPTVFNDLITVTGTNTLLGTSVPPINGYVAGATYSFVVPNTNTGAVTISIDGLGAKEITYAGSTVLIPGQLVANSIAVIEYDGTRFQLMQSSASIATVASLNVTNDAVIGGKLTVAGNNISAVNSLGFRNRIINGDMRIDQRNNGASGTTTNVYTLDRWQYVGSTTSKVTWQQNAGSVTPPAGFSNYFGITSSSAYSVPAGELYSVTQAIEGLNVADLAWGSASAQSVTLSFWVRSSLTGTFGGSLQNSANNRSYPFTFSVSAANTWEQKSVVIPGDTTGTWLTTNGVGIYVRFALGTGSSFSGPAGAWAGADYYSATGAVSVVGTNGATWYVTGVQLEAGSVATPFERRDIGRELMMCQRYYAKILIGFGAFHSSSSAQMWAYTPVSMRATPTTSLVSGTSIATNTAGAGASSIASPTISGVNEGSITVYGAVSPTSATGVPINFGSNLVQVSAEL